MNKFLMREELEEYREHYSKCTTSCRLNGIPFPYSGALFNVDRFPCHSFSKQLVLKIVDELLDEGGN